MTRDEREASAPISLTPIGVVRSPVADERDAGWGQVASRLELRRDFAAGLQGLERFSHAVVVYWMHRAVFDPSRDLVRRPRGRADLPETGIFAQRAKHRPNPIGISAVRLLRVDDSVVHVQGLDAIDGSPILDLKPYVAAFDRIEAPTATPWMLEIMAEYF